MTIFNPYDPDVHILARNEEAYNYYVNDGRYDPLEGKQYGIPINGFGAVKKLYKNNRFKKEKITSTSSIFFGIIWLYYKVQESGKVRLGIERYNGGGDEDYLRKIRKNLKKRNPNLVRGDFWKRKIN